MVQLLIRTLAHIEHIPPVHPPHPQPQPHHPALLTARPQPVPPQPPQPPHPAPHVLSRDILVPSYHVRLYADSGSETFVFATVTEDQDPAAEGLVAPIYHHIPPLPPFPVTSAMTCAEALEPAVASFPRVANAVVKTPHFHHVPHVAHARDQYIVPFAILVHAPHAHHNHCGLGLVCAIPAVPVDHVAPATPSAFTTPLVWIVIKFLQYILYPAHDIDPVSVIVRLS